MKKCFFLFDSFNFRILSIISYLFFSLVNYAQVVSQKIGDNPTMINSSAVLHIESNNKGVLIPRIQLDGATDILTITTPAIGLLIYNTTNAGTGINVVTPGFYFWNGARWIRIATGNPILSEVDGIVGNEVTDAVANGGLTRIGSGTSSNPYRLKINDGTQIGQILVWDGSKWVSQEQIPAWNLNGNIGTDPSTNFIGTNDQKDMIFKTNNTENLRMSSTGKIGVRTSSPKSYLDVNGSLGLPIVTINSNITLNDEHAIVYVDASFGDILISLPSASSAANRIYSIIKKDDTMNFLNFDEIIYGNGFSFTTVNIPGEYKIQSDGTSWILLR